MVAETLYFVIFVMCGVPVLVAFHHVKKEVASRRPLPDWWTLFSVLHIISDHRDYFPNSPWLRRYYTGSGLAIAWMFGGLPLLQFFLGTR